LPSYECAYCGKVASATDDHIPPRSIYSKPYPPDRPSVKACAECNNGASDDDEYFRDIVLKYEHVSDLPAAREQVAKMIRAIAKPEKKKYAAAVLSSFTEIELRSEGGIILGKAPAYKVDGARFTRAASRYVRGLYRYQLGKRVPDDMETHVTANPDGVNTIAKTVVSTFRGAPRRVVQSGVFWYAWLEFQDVPGAYGWLLVFFDHFPVLGTIRPKRVGVAAL